MSLTDFLNTRFSHNVQRDATHLGKRAARAGSGDDWSARHDHKADCGAVKTPKAHSCARCRPATRYQPCRVVKHHHKDLLCGGSGGSKCCAPREPVIQKVLVTGLAHWESSSTGMAWYVMKSSSQVWRQTVIQGCPVPWGWGGAPLFMMLGCWGWHVACNIDAMRIEWRQGCAGQRYYRHPMPLPLVSLSGGTPGVGRLVKVCCSLYKLTALACLVRSDSQSHTCICEAAAEIQRAQCLQSITGPPGWIMTRHLHAACRIGVLHHRLFQQDGAPTGS